MGLVERSTLTLRVCISMKLCQMLFERNKNQLKRPPFRMKNKATFKVTFSAAIFLSNIFEILFVMSRRIFSPSACAISKASSSFKEFWYFWKKRKVNYWYFIPCYKKCRVYLPNCIFWELYWYLVQFVLYICYAIFYEVATVGR